MSISQTADVISFFVSALLFAKIVSLTHEQRVDETRQEIFGLRDELFLYAMDNGLFDTDAYKYLRSLMNGFIRYAHRLSATRVIMMYIVSRFVAPPLPDSFSATWESCVATLDVSNRQKMLSFLKQHEIIIASHILHRSLILRTVIKAYAMLLKVTRKTKGPAPDEQSAQDVVIGHAPWRAMEAAATAT
jgi:hypothetical protein